MARQKIKEFYAPEELTPELLSGLVDETEYRPRAILNFVDAVSHDSETIQLDIHVQQVDRFANIVGFSDSSLKTEGIKTERKFVDPFHVKNYHEFKATDSKNMQRSGSEWTLSADGVRMSTEMQEDRRMNLMHWSILSMINDKQFAYQDGDLLLTIPFGDEISDLTSPALPLDNASAKMFASILAMKNEYLRLSGQTPNLIFMNAATGGKFIEIPEVNGSFVAQQSSDPDDSASMFESFTWNGITWVILHEEYPDLDGALKAPIDDDRMIVTVSNVLDPDPDVAGQPFKVHRASNQLNANDPSRAFYDVFEVSKDPYALGHRMYDNWIPGVAKRTVVFHWNAVTTA
jgi:Phage major capsid protein E